MTPHDLAPSLFDAFNARQIEPHKVAKTFVPPEHYAMVAMNRHTILVGPRGSGKTTLLKMLQQPALEAWEHPLAQQYRDAINYTGVFIPFDQSWNAQMRSLGSGRLDEGHRQRLSIAAFTTHMLKSLVTAMHNRKYGSPRAVVHHRRVDMDDWTEARLVTELSNAWHVGPIVPSLRSLKHALAFRLSRIAEIALQESGRNAEGRDDRFTQMPMLHIHFLQAASHAIEVFNDLAHDEEAKWALLFDELELAPEWVCRELTTSLRSFDDRFLFKLSLSPFTAEVLFLESVSAAMPGHDYDMIPLWYAHKEAGLPFCEDLFAAMLKRKGLTARTPEHVFGEALFDAPTGNRSVMRSAYGPGSSRQRTFNSLAAKDASFAAYLRHRGVDLNHLHEYTEDERAKDIRKIMPLVLVRDAFRTSDSMHTGALGRALRSRKNPRLYAGARSLFTIVEGNPRWFLGLVGPLLDTLVDGRRIPTRHQSDAIAKAAHRFRALLRTIPCPPIEQGIPPRGLLSLLDTIGKYLFDAVVIREFDPDVPGSFIIDSHPTDDLLSSLKQAMNSGAIVYVPDEHGLTLVLRRDNLKGKRFRLSYLLAADFDLPIRLGRGVALRSILRTAPGPLPLFKDGES
jgi:hypothetical protein